MATIEERIKQNEEKELYRLYISECVRAQGEGKYITVNFEEFLHPKKKKDNRTPEQILIDTLTHAGIEVK